MRLKVIGSGSSGNCYILENEHEALVLECGMSMKSVKIELGFNISKIAGAVVSHSHIDHAAYVTQFIRSGINVYSSYGTQTDLIEKYGERTIPVPPLKKMLIGNFTVTPFNVPHGADIECYGYLIEHKEMGKLVFLTDLERCDYNFKKQKLNHIIIEANYSMDYVDRDNPNYEHVLRGHMNIDTTLDFLRANNNPALRNVVLCHLSSKSADSSEFKLRAKEFVDCNVNVAKKGLKVDLSLHPF